MTLKVSTFAGLAGALFDYFSGTDQTQGLIPLGKTVFGPDGAAPTAVGTAAGTRFPVDTVCQSVSTDRGAIIGFTGAQISTTSGSNTITLTTAPTAGTWQLGQIVAAAGIPLGSYLYALASGTQGAAGSTYTLSSSPTTLVAANATAAAAGVATTSVGPQQIMAANTARRGISYQVQSPTASVWTNGTAGTATTDYHSLKIPSASYFESHPTHVGTGAVYAISDTPGTPLYSREW